MHLSLSISHVHLSSIETANVYVYIYIYLYIYILYAPHSRSHCFKYAPLTCAANLNTVMSQQEQLASTILRIFQLPTRTNAESIHARNDMSHHSKFCPEEVCIPSTLSEGIKVMAGVEQAAGMNNIANIERKIATVRAGTYDSSV